MEKQGVRANIAAYDALIIGYCAKGVNELLNEMLEKGLIVKLLTK